MTTEALSPEAQKVVETAEKLLRLAARNPNENEAASATAKAMDMLAAYNLDVAAVERHGGETGKRANEELIGGYYEWQQDLWRSVAHLNFCLYWHQMSFVPMPGGKVVKYREDEETGLRRRIEGIQQPQHRVAGRVVNIAATKAMASYLEQVVERLTKERCRAGQIPSRSKWATSYRQGVTTRLSEKIYERRKHLIAEQERVRLEAEATARKEGRADVSTGTALVLSVYADSEIDATADFVFGEGTAARWAKERAEKAAKKKAAEEEYTRWAAENPAAARKLEEKREREQERKDAKEARKVDGGAFWDGYDTAANISIDPQAEGFKPKGYI